MQPHTPPASSPTGHPPYLLAPARLLATAAARAECPAYHVRTATGWHATNWRDFAAEVQQAARALVDLGVRPGDAVCILGFNRPEWLVMDHAAMMVGAVAAGIYWTSAPGEVEYILAHSAAPLLLVEDAQQAAKLAGRRAALPHLRQVVAMKGAPAVDGELLGWEAFMARGTEAHQAELERRMRRIRGGDAGTLIYTSGTTGPPKAVVLSHDNLAWTADALVRAFQASGHDRLISYLPMAHVAEQISAVHMMAHAGVQVFFAQSLEALSSHLPEVQPTIFVGVPRVWEKMQAALQARLAGLSGTKKRLADWAQRSARDYHARRLAGQAPGLRAALRLALARRLVLNKIKRALGLDQGRVLISAAAPIAPECLRFFSGLDLVIGEVYGQSEVSGPTTVSLPGATLHGSVGQPLAGVEVRIAEDGEILVRGPNVFQGYAGAPEATAEALVDGWLHSGDLGRRDEQGYLYITGRKKDLIITSGGKNVSPANLEAALMNLPLVEHAVVVGDGRHFLAALLTLKPDALAAFAERQQLPVASAAQLSNHPAVRAELQRGIDALNQAQSRVAAIRRFVVLAEPLSIAAGELTATLKIRRKAVLERHGARVEQLYAQEAPSR
ncbi:AMP-dependent synthetase/ligase [Pelomonas sp. CA6]|uniref:AMP-dependent synthetase/ligase n=1 Tax=Pelomonas sp. CA6 TaxID=2907999 RepID=UPI001F4C501E|nr:AMP-dependent synthetase/ligase [Pelomonas sp. CA6]MCH7344599.1 AMP-dependent synthetase/ligase [Pelomonas sp. CA6]